MLNAIVEQHGWEHGKHRHLSRVASRLLGGNFATPIFAERRLKVINSMTISVGCLPIPKCKQPRETPHILPTVS